VDANVRKRWALCKKAAQQFNVERFNFMKLSELEVRVEQ